MKSELAVSLGSPDLSVIYCAGPGRFQEGTRTPICSHVTSAVAQSQWVLQRRGQASTTIGQHLDEFPWFFTRSRGSSDPGLDGSRFQGLPPVNTIFAKISVTQQGKGQWPIFVCCIATMAAEAVALAASVVALVQITQSTIALVGEIYSIYKSQHERCFEFERFKKRLDQVHRRVEELSRKETSVTCQEEYQHVEQLLLRCRDFLEKLGQQGRIARYLTSKNGEARLQTHHGMIDQCYNILTQRSLDRVEEKIGVYHDRLDKKIDQVYQALNRIPRHSTSLPAGEYYSDPYRQTSASADIYAQYGEPSTSAPAEPSFVPQLCPGSQTLEPDSYDEETAYTYPEETLGEPSRRHTLEPDSYDGETAYPYSTPSGTEGGPSRRQTAPETTIPPNRRPTHDSGYWTGSIAGWTDVGQLLSLETDSECTDPFEELPHLDASRGHQRVRDSINSTTSHNGNYEPNFDSFSFENNAGLPSYTGGMHPTSTAGFSEISPRQSVSSSVGSTREPTIAILYLGKRQFHLSSNSLDRAEYPQRIDWYSARDSTSISHYLPGQCLPRILKTNTTHGFKYRVFFACHGHQVVIPGNDNSNNKTTQNPEYLFQYRSECKQFVRQLTWPAIVEIFDTSRIQYKGGKNPPTTLHSPLILRKTEPSASSPGGLAPTLSFTLRLQNPHETRTYNIRWFLPQAEVTTKDKDHPEITLLFNSTTRGGKFPSLSRRADVRWLYKNLPPELIDTHREGLVIQFPSESMLRDFLEMSRTFHQNALPAYDTSSTANQPGFAPLLQSASEQLYG